MRAQVGDRIVLTATRVDDPTRHGTIIEVGGAEGGPPFTVRWSDGHVGVFYPGPGSVMSIGEHKPGDEATPAETVVADALSGPAGAEPAAPTPGQVREWQVRISIVESGDDTTATVVLLSDAPEHLQARGTSRRSVADDPIAEIGDEVAVARALRHLADRLLDSAETDIEAATGQPAQVRRV